MGGGGGGGRGLTPDETKRLGDLVAEKIKKAAQAKRNVFISFANEDLNEVNLLRGQAKNQNSDIEFNDWSLREPFDSSKADYIRRGIRERIRQSSVTVVYLSPTTKDSKWVDWEVRESLNLGKPVIGVYKGDAQPSKLPSAFTEHKLKVVSWNHADLSAAIAKAETTK